MPCPFPHDGHDAGAGAPATTTEAPHDDGMPHDALHDEIRRRMLPTDGTPTSPSPSLARWRAEGKATPLHYPDGHDGLIVTDWALAREVLADRRFSQQPSRIPGSNALHGPDAPLDDDARRALEITNILGKDGDEHSRLRRAVMRRFAVRPARERRPAIQEIVRRHLDALRAAGSPADLTEVFAEPVSADTHALVLGLPPEMLQDFHRLFVHPATTQERMDYIRAAIARKGDERDEDVLSDLLTAETARELDRDEVEGLMMVLMMSGRDTVAYMIATMTVALLTNPDQLARLCAEPELLPTALEELLRYSTMFVTVFTRTPTEDVEVEGVAIPAGQTVSVSITAANRDPERFEHPDVLDVTRDAAGHVAFGHGIHDCVGQQLARVELQEAMGALIAEFPGLHLVSAEQLEPMPFANDVATYQAGSVVVGW